MTNKAPQASVQALTRVARVLGHMLDDVVFIGGSVVGFLITDPAAEPVRTTLDVDLVVQAVSRSEYNKVIDKLTKEHGFKHDIFSGTMCRYNLGEEAIDVLPSQPSVLGMRGDWTKTAIEHFNVYPIEDGLHIKIVDAIYFLAIKLEAYQDRAKDIYHRDMEDIVALINGRPTLLSELEGSPDKDLRGFIKNMTNDLKEDLLASVPAHLAVGEKLREGIVRDRIERISLL